MGSPTTRPCTSCGTPVTKRVLGRKRGRPRPWLCTDCAAARIIEHNMQIHQGEGPAYEAWRDGMHRWAKNL